MASPALRHRSSLCVFEAAVKGAKRHVSVFGFVFVFGFFLYIPYFLYSPCLLPLLASSAPLLTLLHLLLASFASSLLRLC